MIVRRATYEDLSQLAVLFDEYRQFYGASSNLEESHHFLKQRFENKESVFSSILRTKNYWVRIALFRFFFSCLFNLLHLR